jgi:hypothetical protein
MIHGLSVYDTYYQIYSIYIQHVFTSGKCINVKANDIALPNTASEIR